MSHLVTTSACACFLVAVACGSDSSQALSATSSAPAPPSSSEGQAGRLPRARNVEPMIDAPTVAVRGSEVLVDGQVVASTEEILRSGRVRRLDGQFDALKRIRESFKVKNPGRPFPGVVLLELEEAARGRLVLSVFQTAAYAGFPNVSFVVEPIDGAKQTTRARMSVNAMVPGPPGGPAEAEPRLFLDASAPDKLVLGWLSGSELGEATTVHGQDLRAVADRVEAAWRTKGRHSSPDDSKVDQAVLEVGLDTELSVLIGALDALYAPKRSVVIEGAPSVVPAFAATLAMPGWRAATPAPAPAPADVGARFASFHVRGHLPPEVISRIMKSALPAYAACRKTETARSLPLRFEIGAQGQVTSASAGPSGDGDPVSGCVVALTKRLAFPAPESGPVAVSVTIDLEP